MRSKSDERLCMLSTAHDWGYLAINSEANGMNYVIDPDDRGRILIATNSGRVIMTKKQALAFATEFGEIAELYMR